MNKALSESIKLIEDTWAVAEDARRYLRTPEGRQDMIIRSQLERVNNELKNNLGLKVSRYYGLAKHQISYMPPLLYTTFARRCAL